MSNPGEGSTFRNVFYAIGYALGEAEARIVGAGPRGGEAEPVPAAAGGAAAAAGRARPSPPNGAIGDAGVVPPSRPGAAERAPGGSRAAYGRGRPGGLAGAAAPRGAAVPGPSHPGAAAGAAFGAAAAAWLLARLFRPRPVRWPRVLLAGVAGTALLELADAVERRLGTVPPDAPPPDGPLRYAAGIATAAAYASLLYPRLPGAPAARGLVFGALEAAATRAGGTFTLLRRLSPQISLPVEALAPPVVPARGPLSAVAFGIGLGLYRDGDR